ncbi:unnamed protein product [Menidia menidia]|uniref:(Atlantic silverside) hypothetical protein n=1 Tax=Menidia menidia TaxID=238744 RepID=A0A8S4AL43_9TELE|nr:unnamed protein product [Menidia menidia]
MKPTRSHWQTFLVVAVCCHLLAVEGVRSEVLGKVGGLVELGCSVPPTDPASLHVVEWIRQGLDIPVLIKFGSYAPRVNPHYEGRVSLVRLTNLRLERLQLDDQGFKTPPPVVEALVGSHLFLPCVANGNPSPTITWLKDGGVIDSSSYQGGGLSLRAVSAQTAGLYTCHASNAEGNVTSMAKVKIKGPPVIVVPPKSISINVSQNALLQCQAVADPPNMTYVWQRGGENVHHVEFLKSRVKIMVDGTLLISGLIPEDSGNYTCTPTNGLLTPPSASAILTVMHPAQALQMPRETYLPTGMEGMVTCPVVAQPPLLRVDWTKDGEPLDLSLDAAGTYTCTPHNGYGSMGASGPTSVILQDPPSFSIAPEKQYKQDAGGTLLIPCQGNAEPTIKVTWSKIDVVRPIVYAIEPNGSLLLQPLTKDHHGEWECSASNRVATVKARTHVFVLGTSPHAATSLSVSPGVRQANISWEAGFDGGSAQTFSVWGKKISAGDNEGEQDWFSVLVPLSSGTRLQVSGLSPATEYQFSILSQNKIGTGPFSEITTAKTLDPPPSRNKLKPPALLSANQDPAGVILQWSLPEAQQPPITGFVLQSRTEGGEWFSLDEDISANESEIVIPGMEMSNPATSQLLEFVPGSLLVGVLGGLGFMCLALVLLLGSACVISRRRNQQRRRKKTEPLPAIYKCSTSIKTSGSSSPDSLLKRNLLPASSLYATTSSTITTSSSQTDGSSLSVDDHHRRKHLTSNYSRGRLTKTTSLISPSIELISRGPDGRFTMPPYDHDTLTIDSISKVRYDQYSAVRRSVSLQSEGEDMKERPFVLSVDFPPCKTVDDSKSQTASLPHRSPPAVSQMESYDCFPDLGSMCSSSSLATVRHHHHRPLSPTFPVLPHIRAGFGQPSTTASALVLQMEHERETGNLSRCLKLAQEREELEKELQRYTIDRNSLGEMKSGQLDLDRRGGTDEKLEWEYRSSTLPSRYHKGIKENSPLSPSPSMSSSVHWYSQNPGSQPNLMLPKKHLSTSSPFTPSYFTSNSPAHPLFDKQPVQSEEDGGFQKGSLTIPSLPSKRQRLKRAQASPEGYYDLAQSKGSQSNDSCSEAQRQNDPRNGSFSTFSINRYDERCNSTLEAARDSSRLEATFPEPAGENLSVEMSVDEPEIEAFVSRPVKHMLHHRISSHVQHGCSLAQRGRPEAARRSAILDSRSRASVDDVTGVQRSLQLSEPDRWRSVSLASNVWDPKQRSQSLPSRRDKRRGFLAPDAWVDTLSQRNSSAASSSQTDLPLWKSHSSPQGNSSKSPSNSPPAIQTTLNSPPVMDHLSSSSSPHRLVPNPSMSHSYDPRISTSPSDDGAKCAVAYRESMKEEGCVLKKPSSCMLPNNINQEAFEVEAGDYEGVPESGSSYSSYASSGRGSMEAPNRRLSMCQLSPTLISSPETVEDTQGSSADKHSQKDELRQRRKPSVDENYEWDATEICSQPGDHDGLLPPVNLQKPTLRFSLPGMQSSTKAEKNCTELSSLSGHQSNSSAEPEPETVLF